MVTRGALFRSDPPRGAAIPAAERDSTPRVERPKVCVARRCPGDRASVRPVPAQGLPGDPGDGGKVPVVMEQRQAKQFRGRGDDKVHRPGAAVLTQGGEVALHLPRASVRTVMDRHPAEGGPQIPERVFAVLSGSGAVEELQLGDRADRD
jgi:hypothetical protein